MRFFYPVMFAIISIVLGATGHITVRDMYIGVTVFLAAEYIECAIDRKKSEGEK